jgi:hypothetical protein
LYAIEPAGFVRFLNGTIKRLRCRHEDEEVAGSRSCREARRTLAIYWGGFVGATPGVPPSLPGSSPFFRPRLPGGNNEQISEQLFPMERINPTRIAAGVEAVLSVRTPFKSTSCPAIFSAEKLPVNLAHSFSLLSTIVSLSVAERCTQPA